MRRLRPLYDWFDHRLGLTRLFESSAGHLVPREAGSWFYVFGSATLVCFVLQLVTGVCLAFVYVPSGAEAWPSLQYLNHQVFLGWFLRAVHGWGSNFMVALMTLHMIQVFLFGAYKYPRELTWIVGVALFLMTLGMAFTGQVLRFDQDAYWGLGIGASIMARSPFIGAQLVRLMLGGPTIGGETLSRFFTLHVFVVPGLISLLVMAHLRLVLLKGINEFPKPGKEVRKESYASEYQAILQEQGVRFYPDAIGKDAVFSALTVLSILLCAAILGPFGPAAPPDPTWIETDPRPDFYFLSLFAAFALTPAYMETFLILALPVIGIAVLFVLPFLSATGEKSPLRRPVAVLSVLLIMLTIGILAGLGLSSPWSPDMDAWSRTPTPPEQVKTLSPLELQGALIVQSKQCRNCHALGGRGGRRGPPLDDVAAHLTRDQLIRQVLQGGGNMPAYGKHLRPPEVTALVAFLETLVPPGRAPARSSVLSAKPSVTER